MMVGTLVSAHVLLLIIYLGAVECAAPLCLLSFSSWLAIFLKWWHIHRIVLKQANLPEGRCTSDEPVALGRSVRLNYGRFEVASEALLHLHIEIENEQHMSPAESGTLR